MGLCCVYKLVESRDTDLADACTCTDAETWSTLNSMFFQPSRCFAHPNPVRTHVKDVLKMSYDAISQIKTMLYICAIERAQRMHQKQPREWSMRYENKEIRT